MTTETAPGAVGAVIAGQRVELLDRARVYACGITPYDVTHVGHAATFVWIDTLGRVLRLLGVQPEVCRNVTDVDDVLDVAAGRAGAAYDEFAAIQQFGFDRDMEAMGVRSPEHEPRAHRYVAQVIRLATGLLDVGAAYHRAGGVYFRGAGVAERAGLGRAGALALSGEFGGRPDDPAKQDPLDVAVWQAAEPGHPAWDSPWGPGRPGWHAECAAMAMSVFGPAVDVHAGGAELRFPHHAYRAEMAESAGNLVLVGDLLADHPAGAVRLMILDRPWAHGWDYRPELLDGAAIRLESLYRAAARKVPDDAAAVAELRRLLAADLNVPAALDLAAEAGGAAARTLASVLGLT